MFMRRRAEAKVALDLGLSPVGPEAARRNGELEDLAAAVTPAERAVLISVQAHVRRFSRRRDVYR